MQLTFGTILVNIVRPSIPSRARNWRALRSVPAECELPLAYSLLKQMNLILYRGRNTVFVLDSRPYHESYGLFVSERHFEAFRLQALRGISDVLESYPSM